jgi:mRNA interferase MazF
LLIADAGRNDWIACQITSNPYTDNHSMVLTDMDFQRGNLAHISYVRPTKLFTAHEALVEQIIGSVRNKFLDQVRESIIRVIREQE